MPNDTFHIDFVIFRRRDSAPVQNFPRLGTAPNPSSSFYSINLPTSPNDRLNASVSTSFISNKYRQSTDFILIAQNRLEIGKETKMGQVDSETNAGKQEESPYRNGNDFNYLKSTFRTIYNVLPSNPFSSMSTKDHNHSPLSSSSSHCTPIENQQMINIDTTLREILSGVQNVEECHAQYFRPRSSSNIQRKIDAPDLVLSLLKSNKFTIPSISKSPSLVSHSTINHKTPLVHSTFIIDLMHSSQSSSTSPEPIQRKNRPPPVMKKSEKALQLIQQLGLSQTYDSSCDATSLPSSKHFNVTHHQQPISISVSPKVTQV